MTLKHKIILTFLSLVLNISGYVLLGYLLGWKVSFAVSLLMWANNIDRKIASEK